MTKRNNYLLKRYGISEEQYESLLEKQGGCCAVCRRTSGSFRTRLCIDHDHITGHVRGLLCHFCNRRVIGRHRDPSGTILLKSAYEYLLGPYPGWIVPPKIKKKKRKKYVKKLQLNKSRPAR